MEFHVQEDPQQGLQFPQLVVERKMIGEAKKKMPQGVRQVNEAIRQEAEAH